MCPWCVYHVSTTLSNLPRKQLPLLCDYIGCVFCHTIKCVEKISAWIDWNERNVQHVMTSLPPLCWYIVGTIFLKKCQKGHLSVEVGVLRVDRPTQLICISDIIIFICQQTNTKDIAGQSATLRQQWYMLDQAQSQYPRSLSPRHLGWGPSRPLCKPETTTYVKILFQKLGKRKENS